VKPKGTLPRKDLVSWKDKNSTLSGKGGEKADVARTDGIPLPSEGKVVEEKKSKLREIG